MRTTQMNKITRFTSIATAFCFLATRTIQTRTRLLYRCRLGSRFSGGAENVSCGHVIHAEAPDNSTYPLDSCDNTSRLLERSTNQHHRSRIRRTSLLIDLIRVLPISRLALFVSKETVGEAEKLLWTIETVLLRAWENWSEGDYVNMVWGEIPSLLSEQGTHSVAFDGTTRAVLTCFWHWEPHFEHILDHISSCSCMRYVIARHTIDKYESIVESKVCP